MGYDLGSLIDGLTFNAGLRYTWDDFPGCSTTGPYRAPRIGYDGCRSGTGVEGKVKSHAPTWTLGLDYQVTPNIFTRSEEHTSELQSLMRISYAVFCLKKKKKNKKHKQ